MFACLPPVPPEAARPALELRAEEPAVPQGTLRAAGGPRMFGRFAGSCPGTILMEIRSPGRPGALTTNRLRGESYELYLPDGDDLYLRYGCDRDDDGVVVEAELVVIEVASSVPLPPIELLLPDPDGFRVGTGEGRMPASGQGWEVSIPDGG